MDKGKKLAESAEPGPADKDLSKYAQRAVYDPFLVKRAFSFEHACAINWLDGV